MAESNGKTENILGDKNITLTEKSRVSVSMKVLMGIMIVLMGAMGKFAWTQRVEDMETIDSKMVNKWQFQRFITNDSLSRLKRDNDMRELKHNLKKQMKGNHQNYESINEDGTFDSDN